MSLRRVLLLLLVALGALALLVQVGQVAAHDEFRETGDVSTTNELENDDAASSSSHDLEKRVIISPIKFTRPAYIGPLRFKALTKVLQVKTRDRRLAVPAPPWATRKRPTITMKPPWLTTFRGTKRRTTTPFRFPGLKTTARRATQTTKTTSTKSRTLTSTTTVDPFSRGYVPKNCLPADPNVNGQLLDCYLDAFPSLKTYVSFRFKLPDNTGNSLFWFQWDASRKQQLRDAFKHAWNWLEAGGTYTEATFGGWYPNDTVGGNLVQPFVPGTSPQTLWDQETQAFPWYCAHAAHALALEVRGTLPWNLRSQSAELIKPILFGAEWMPYTKQSVGAGDVTVTAVYGHLVYDGRTTPAHPVFVWKWLYKIGALDAITQNAADPIAAQTKAIGKILDFARWNFAHFLGGGDWNNYNYYWGGRVPAVSQLILGTVATDPILAFLGNTPYGWTAGCYGTSAFLQHVMRELNIPVKIINDPVITCGHTTIQILSLDRYLTHGDDPYSDTRGYGNYVAPPELLLTPGDLWRSWFMTGVGDTSCKMVGRRPNDIQVEFGYPSAGAYARYCYDFGRGLVPLLGATTNDLVNSSLVNHFIYFDSASSTLQNFVYKPFYAPQELISNGFYDHLEFYRQTFGCATAPVCWPTTCQDGSMNCASCNA